MHPSLSITGTSSRRLRGRKIVLAVTGSVALVKSFELCRELMRRGAGVQVVMSEAAQRLMSGEMMHYASGRKPITGITGRIEHVEWFGEKGRGDLLLVAPATANTISKVAMGVDDTPVTTFATTAIGSGKPVVLVPAMHYSMYSHAVVKKNLKTLRRKGVLVMEPLVSEGKAKIANTGDVVLECERALLRGALEGKRVLVSGGTTYEPLDAVRVLTTRASGRTGLEIAREAYRRGAEVTLIHNGSAEAGIKSIKVETFTQMRSAVLGELERGKDVFISSAAVGDFSVAGAGKGKISSGSRTSIALVPNGKIIETARKKFPEKELFIVGFKAEANKTKKQLVGLCRKFMQNNRLQMVVGNDVAKGGMGTGENTVVILLAGKAKGKMQKTKKPLWVSGRKEIIAEKIVGMLALG